LRYEIIHGWFFKQPAGLRDKPGPEEKEKTEKTAGEWRCHQIRSSEMPEMWKLQGAGL